MEPTSSLTTQQSAPVSTSVPHLPIPSQNGATFKGRIIRLVELALLPIVQLISYAVRGILSAVEYTENCLKSYDPAVTEPLGHGIRNGGNSCYMNAVIQALRFTPHLTRSLEPTVIPQVLQVRQALTHLHDINDGRISEGKREISTEEISEFRQKMISLGFRAENETSQEDAAQFCQFLLDRLGVSTFDIKTQVFHELGLEVPSFKGVERENHIALGLSNAANGTALKDLALSNIVIEEIEKQKILNNTDLKITKEQIQKMETLRPIEEIPTFQSIHLTEAKLPPAFPIVLKRFSYNRETGGSVKKQTHIIPSEVIDFPLVDQPNKKARYHLAALVVHSGSSLESGHYYTYVPRETTDGHSEYVEYNDTHVKLHTDPEKSKRGLFTGTVYDDACKNGYIFFYQFLRFVSNADSA